MKTLGLLLGLFFGLPAIAGGSSTVGPGAPQIEVGCFDFKATDKLFEVTVGRYWPNYDLQLAIIDRAGQNVSSEEAKRVDPSTMGGDLTYQSRQSELRIYATTTPIVFEGRTYSYSELIQNGQVIRTLKCELLSTN